jgi:hypothetical protein
VRLLVPWLRHAGARVSWQTTKPPRQDEYLAVDKVYGFRSVATYTIAQGWCINGKWLGHDAFECWQELDAVPKRGKAA